MPQLHIGYLPFQSGCQYTRPLCKDALFSKQQKNSTWSCFIGLFFKNNNAVSMVTRAKYDGAFYKNLQMTGNTLVLF